MNRDLLPVATKSEIEFSLNLLRIATPGHAASAQSSALEQMLSATWAADRG